MEVERNDYASKGVAGAGLGLGIAGTALGLLGGNIFGGWGAGVPGAMSAENSPVNRYELKLVQENASLKSDIALRDANTYGDQKLLEVYKYFDGKLNEIGATLASQAVHNQRTEDSFVLARQDIAAVKAELSGKIEREAERRCCSDNAIVTYANATFYPKMVADVTTGTDTTAQSLYNPIPSCGCGCG